MSRPSLDVLACFLAGAVATSPVMARDYGQLGTVFPIIEPDLLRVIENRLRSLQASGQIDAANQMFAKRTEAKVRRPDPVSGISAASATKSWLFDPSVTIDHDIRDMKGNLVAKAGSKVNPLDYVLVKTPLVFINGDDEDELAWAVKHYPDPAKIIMVRGAPLDAMTKFQRRFYFDQNGTLTRRFGIVHTPAAVVQAGKAMRVTETALSGKAS